MEMQTLAFVFLVVGVVGCGGSDGSGPDASASNPVCGDRVCNGGESVSTCATDCGTPACSTSPDNCTGEMICVASSCVAAFPRVYRVTNISVMVPTTNPVGGGAWDVGGGAPDMFIGEGSGGATKLSAVVQDQFSATFPGPIQFNLIGGSTLRIDVWDEDVTTNDPVTACQRAPITAAALRSRTFNCAGSGITFTAAINPM